MRHLLSVTDLDAAAATALLDTADRLRQALLGREVRKLPTLRGRTVITMFYENSTRTRVSFEVAGKWMSADTVNVSASGSSVAKGESLRDTALTLSAMGADCVIVGRSNIVGKPMASLMVQPGVDATVTVAHSKTRDLASHTRRADILIVAAGRAQMITADMVKPGAVVIDVGMNRIPDSSKKSGTRLVGDVAFDEVRRVASLITPVPGGVGKMTIAMLMSNTVRAAAQQTQ